MGTIAEKLTYLNTTKEKIKDSINLTGSNLTSEDTFRSYAAKLNKGYIDIINNGIDTLYNNFPKVSGIGSNLSLTPTYEAPIKLNEIDGDTLQDGTPTPDSPVEIESVTGRQEVSIVGKNLMPFTNQNFTLKNLRYYAQNGSLYIDGTSTGETSSTDEAFKNNFSFYLEAGTYIISVKYLDPGRAFHIRRYSDDYDIAVVNTKTQLTQSFTLNERTQVYFSTYMYNATFSNYNIEFQLEKGSKATTYEAYSGNTYEVNLGKNLFDKDNVNMLNVYFNANGVIANADTRSFYIPCKPNTTYTIQKNGSARFRIGTTKTIPENGVSVANYVANDNDTPITITTSNTAKYIICYFYATFDTNTKTLEQVLDTIQIEVGSQATSYSPYFTPIELNEIGDYEDSIKKSTGKNLFDKSTATILDLYIDGSTIKESSYNKMLYIPCEPNTTYTIQKKSSPNSRQIAYTTELPALNVSVYGTIDIPANGTIGTITTGSDAKYLICRFYQTTQDSNTPLQQMLDSIMINEGSTALSYEPYGKVWYEEKQIGKVNLEDYEYNKYGASAGYSRNTTTQIPNIKYVSVNTELGKGLCEKYQIHTGSGMSGNDAENHFAIDVSMFQVSIPNNDTPSGLFYYALATPEYTEITNTELINQLEELYTAKSQEGTTNISITSEDLEMILNVSALKIE